MVNHIHRRNKAVLDCNEPAIRPWQFLDDCMLSIAGRSSNKSPAATNKGRHSVRQAFTITQLSTCMQRHVLDKNTTHGAHLVVNVCVYLPPGQVVAQNG
jgi:hypothetical protein